MSEYPIGAHRGYRIFQRPYTPSTDTPVYYSPGVPGIYFSVTALEKKIDQFLEAEEAPPPLEPEPPTTPEEEDDQFIETYRGVDIWLIPHLRLYKYEVTPEYKGVSATPEDARGEIDNILAFIEDPRPREPEATPEDPDDILMEVYAELPIFLDVSEDVYYLIHEGQVHTNFNTIDEAREFIESVISPPTPPTPYTPGDSPDYSRILKDPTIAADLTAPIQGFIRSLGLTPETLEAVKGSPVDREKAAMIASSISTAAQTGLGLLYSVGVLAEIASLGQIETVTEAIDNILIHTGLDDVLKPIFRAPFIPSIFNPTFQYWRSRFPTEIPQQQDLITFVVREVIGPDDFEKWMSYHGFDKEWSAAYWEAHWRLPSRDEIIRAFHRKVLTEDEKNKYLVLHDYRPDTRPGISKTDVEIVSSLQKTPIPRVDVRRGFKLGDIDDAELLRRYEVLGYEDDAELMARIQKRAAFSGLQNAVIREAMYLVETDKITANDFMEIYTQAREMYDEPTLWLTRAQLRKIRFEKEEEEEEEELDVEEEAEEAIA